MMKDFPLRKWIIRVSLVIVYIGAAVILFVTGRGHTIIVDNKADPNGAYPAVNGALVSVDREEPMEFFPRDRDKFLVKGQRHTIKIAPLSPGGKEAEYAFSVPLGEDMILISISKLMAGVEPWIEAFVAPTLEQRAAERAAEDAETPIESFGDFAP